MFVRMLVARSGIDHGVWIVIPAYNEGAVICDVVEGLLARGYRVIVVDDGSNEPLEGRLSGLHVHLLRHAINLGQGAALQTGITYALRQGADVIVTFDADGQHQSDDVQSLVTSVEAGADVALGSRFLKGGRALRISGAKHLILKVAVKFTRWTTRLAVTDTHNGLRAFRRKAAQALTISQNGMAHASQILHQIAAQRFTYVEVPVTITYTDYSVRKGQRLSNAFNILWDSLTAVFYR